MKKFLVVLLSLGMVVTLCMPAVAMEMSMAGNYIVTGVYDDNRSIVDEGLSGGTNQTTGASMAFYAQRLRLEPIFKIADGLNFHMRIDAMERVWGQTPVGSESLGSTWLNQRNPADEQNIQFRHANVRFLSKVGYFIVGYVDANLYGTDFGDDDAIAPSIVYMIKAGKVVIAAATSKYGEGRLGGTGFAYKNPVAPGYEDSDMDKYVVLAAYFGKNGVFGMLAGTGREHSTRPVGFKLDFMTYRAYYKASFGKLYSEAEVQYDHGKLINYEAPLDAFLDDVHYEAMQWYLMARYNIGPVNIGFQYAHSDGDADGIEDGKFDAVIGGGNIWQPSLILWNDWIHRFAGSVGNVANAQVDNTFDNANLYQIFAGYNPTPKLTIKANCTLSYADEKPKGYVDDEYGTEFDLTASYKIFDNLEYMIGFGYLWAGDYFKGQDRDADVDNDYLVLHQLTLTF